MATTTRKGTTAKGGGRKTGVRKATARKAGARKAGASTLKDPKGGLTAAGRRRFAETEGAQLKPGVRGAADTPEKMRRKGSFLRRHFAHPRGPMVDEHGEPTRLALSAHAWGEPVPKTAAAARKLADKGTKLLERYQAAKKGGARKTTKRATTKRPAAKRAATKLSTAKRAAAKRARA